MTIMLTDEQHTIVSHFVAHMPEAKRAVFEAQVSKALQHQHEDQAIDDQGQLAVVACVNAMWMLWSEARMESKCGVFPT